MQNENTLQYRRIRQSTQVFPEDLVSQDWSCRSPLWHGKLRFRFFFCQRFWVASFWISAGFFFFINFVVCNVGFIFICVIAAFLSSVYVCVFCLNYSYFCTVLAVCIIPFLIFGQGLYVPVRHFLFFWRLFCWLAVFGHLSRLPQTATVLKHYPHTHLCLGTLLMGWWSSCEIIATAWSDCPGKNVLWFFFKREFGRQQRSDVKTTVIVVLTGVSCCHRAAWQACFVFLPTKLLWGNLQINLFFILRVYTATFLFPFWWLSKVSQHHQSDIPSSACISPDVWHHFLSKLHRHPLLGKMHSGEFWIRHTFYLVGICILPHWFAAECFSWSFAWMSLQNNYPYLPCGNH